MSLEVWEYLLTGWVRAATPSLMGAGPFSAQFKWPRHHFALFWYNSSTPKFRRFWVKVEMLSHSLCTWHWGDVSFFQLRALVLIVCHKTPTPPCRVQTLLVRLTKSQAPPHSHFSLWILEDFRQTQFHSQGSYFKFNIIKWDWTQCIKWTRITRAARPEIHFVCP